MLNAIRWIADFDVWFAAGWLWLGVLLAPWLAAKALERLGYRFTGRWAFAIAAPLWLLSSFWLISAAGILDNIHCERQTHHPCEDREPDDSWPY